MKDQNMKKIMEQITNGGRTENPEILKLRDNYGWTVAHEQALRGWRTENPEILRLATDSENATDSGYTVAHVQAKRGWTTEDKDILNLTDDNGWTVEDIQKEWQPKYLIVRMLKEE